MPLDPDTIKTGVTTAEAWFSIIGGLGAWETAKWAYATVMAHRKAKRDARDAELAAARDSGKATVEQSRDRRKDALNEWQGIAAEQKQQTHDCQERLSAAEKRLDTCESDRQQLRQRDDFQQRQINSQQQELNALKGRVTKVENGNHE